MDTLKKLLGVAIVVVGLVLLPASVALSQGFCEGNFDLDQDVDGSDASLFKSHFGRSGFNNPCPPDGQSPVPITGQKQNYYGEDDGFWKRGIEYPHDRFEVDGLGLVRDRLTGLKWLSLPAENKTWTQAVDHCPGLIPLGSWRLPNIKEMMSLFDYGYNTPALCNASGYGHHTPGDPFTIPVSQYYWTSTTYDPDDTRAWYYNINYGSLGNQDKAVAMNAWCVTDGHPIYPRFKDNGNGTVTDNTTGLVWLKYAHCFSTMVWDDAMTAAANLHSGDCGLSDGSSAGDWRLPTVNEWEDLFCDQYIDPRLCNSAGTGQWADGDPFTTLAGEFSPAGETASFWTSEEINETLTYAADVSMGDVFMNVSKTSIGSRPWPIRKP